MLAECAGLTDIYIGGAATGRTGGFAAWSNPETPDLRRRLTVTNGGVPHGPQAING